MDAEVLPAADLYGSGKMDDVVFTALERRDRIAEILATVTGKEVPPEWSPWNPRCPACRRLDRGRVLGFDRQAGTIRSRCGACGTEAEQAPREGGKLTWRVDWPARWKAVGVTVEPFGKDHASRGGSWDTGRRISREIYGWPPPETEIYEWIALSGGGDMSSSKGNVLSVAELVEMVPPEVLRYFVLKARPSRRIVFDPGLPLLRLVDEVDDASARGRDDRALALSRAAGFRPVGVPFHHLVLVAQLAGFDPDRVLDLLARGGYPGLDRQAIVERLEMARRWLERFAPDDVKVEVPRELPAGARHLSPAQREFLRRLADRLPALASPGEIGAAIRELANAGDGPGTRDAYRAIYAALLGRDRGPRAAEFIATLGPERAAARFRQAVEAAARGAPGGPAPADGPGAGDPPGGGNGRGSPRTEGND